MNLLAQYLNDDAYQGALSSLKTHDTACINPVGRVMPLPSLRALKQGFWALETWPVGCVNSHYLSDRARDRSPTGEKRYETCGFKPRGARSDHCPARLSRPVRSLHSC